MRRILILFIIVLTSVSVRANDLAPVPVQSVTPDQTWFYNLEDVVFSSSNSYVPNGQITYTKWYVNGVVQTEGSYYRSMSICFALPGTPANGCYQLASGQTTVQVKLEVASNHNLWDDLTITYTIQEHKGRKYFVKDHLGSIRTTVNRDGNVLGYDDYYAFGLQMPGRSVNSANPNDDYKFTGHERDDEAGLTIDYMNARTYDPILGRFMQIDPLASKYPSLSPYAYVSNNPLNAVDPDGRDIWFVHGTFSSQQTWSSSDGTVRYDDLWASAINDHNAGRFSWRGRSWTNASGPRRSAGAALAEKIKEAHDKNPEMLVQLVAHSHGGNVAIEAANILKDKYNITVDRLFLLGTPARDEFTIDEGAVSEIYNFYDENDMVQILGGIDFPIGKESILRMNRLAGRNRSEKGVIEVRVISDRGSVEAHIKLHTTQEIIDWVNGQLNDDSNQKE